MPTSDPPRSPSKCNHCKKEATVSCKGCQDDPTGGLHVKTYYCNSVCQKADWTAHKAHCKGVKARKDVYRVGDLLQHMFYAYREMMFDNVIDKLEEKDGKLVVHFNYTDEPVPGLPKCYDHLPFVFGFPENLDVSFEDKLGILVLQCCEESIALMYDLAKHFLTGLYIDICEMNLSPTNHRRQITTADKNGVEEIEKALNFNHTVLYFNLVHGGGSFVIDLSAAQYGYFEPVVPSALYIRDRVARGGLREARYFKDFGYTKTWYEGRLTPDNPHGALLDLNLKFHPFLLVRTKLWMEENKMSVKDFLNLDEVSYKATKDILVGMVKNMLCNCLTRAGEQYAAHKMKKEAQIQRVKNCDTV